MHKSQGQITIAVFTIIMPFGFAVTDFFGVNATSIRQVMPGIGKALNAACLQSDGLADIFDRSALRAAEKFMFQPRIIDGNAVEVPGVRYF